MKVTLDNWFDENRTHNEKDDDIRRSQIYILNAFIYATGLSVARVFVSAAIWRYGGWQRYDKNSYLEVDIGDLPPGEVMQIVWDGAPVFVRRIAEYEVAEEAVRPTNTLLDPAGEVLLTPAGRSKLIVVSARCTHLGCLPIPYLGLYNGWVCICHGSVFDKYGRVRQGPALTNLKMINNSSYYNGTLVCIEKLIFKRSPKDNFWT